jgi:hypothetical protein
LFHTKAYVEVPALRDETPASFIPDIMQSVIRSSIALCHRHKRNHLFLTSSLLAYEASVAGSLYSALQHPSTEIIVPVFPYRSPQREFPLNAA